MSVPNPPLRVCSDCGAFLDQEYYIHHGDCYCRKCMQGLVPDPNTQYESLLDAVWQAEANWRLDDRIALAARQHFSP